MGHMERGEFYEDDEPIEEVVAAFDAGETFVTAPRDERRRGWNRFLRLNGEGAVATYLAPGAHIAHLA
jgi:hypothetical protein